MEKGKIAVLKSEVESQISEIENIYARIKERAKGKSNIEIESLGFWLHNLYCAFEDLFKIIAKAFENNIMEEERYHIEILKRMTIDIEGVRPALISNEAFLLLDNLRAFRHRIRHAYVYDLDADKVRLVLKDALALRNLYKKDMKKFIDKLFE